jgi:hypothetical protein
MDAIHLRQAAESQAGAAAGSVRASGAQKTEEPKKAAAPAQGKPANQEPEKEWTILLYGNGNNFLSGQVMSTLRQLEYTGSDDRINWVAQVSRPKGLLDFIGGDWSGTRRYKIEWNGEKLTPGVIIGDFFTGWLPGKTKKIKSPVVADLGEKDMGSARTLEEFLEWGIQKYPAKRYMVIMMGPSTGLSGMMKDELSGNQMKVADLGRALGNVHNRTGKKIDLLAFNGSATNTMELAYEIKDHVNYLVGSQGIQAGIGMPVGQIAQELKNANDPQAQDALTMARYWTLMNSMLPAQGIMSSTISAIHLSKIDGVKAAWDELSQALLAANVSGDKLNKLLDQTQDFQAQSKNLAYQNSRDAYHFAQLVYEDKEITDPRVKNAAKAAMDAIEGCLVGDAATGKYVKNAHGLSIFGPTHYGYFRPDGLPIPEDFAGDAEYSKTKFAADTAWDDVLTRAAKDSTFNKALAKMGFSQDAINKLHGVTNQHKGKVTFALGWASFAGWINALNAWARRPASGFLFLNPQQAVYAGIAGAAYDGLQAARYMHYAATQLKDGDEVVRGGFDVARAGLKAVANLGYVVPQLAPYAATAGMLTFFSPWIKDFYGVYDQYKEIRDGIELSNQPTTTKLGQAALQYYGGKKLWDK